MTQFNHPAYPGAFAHPTPPPPPAEPKRRSGLGAAALVLALLALAIGWVPVVGLIMVIPALLAVLLAVIGFVGAVTIRRTGALLPFVAAIFGVIALVVPLVATSIFAIGMIPYGYTIGMDQVQIELERDLKRQGVPAQQAERIGQGVGDVLRSYAKPSQWREGISAAHRFGLICDDYRRTLQSLDEGDADAREAASEAFRAELASLAERQGADLEAEDLDLLSELIGREQLRQVENRRQWERRRSQQRQMVLRSDVRGVRVEACPGSGCE